MASYQDLETRTRVMEDKIAFLLKTFTVTKMEEGQPPVSQTLADVYRDMTTSGARIATAKEIADGTL